MRKCNQGKSKVHAQGPHSHILMTGGSDRGSYFIPKKIPTSEFVYPKKSQLFFLGNIGQENVFCDILERKNTFLGYKNMTSKKSKNWHFSQGVNPWFWSKNGHFSNFFSIGNIGQENVFYDILEGKNTFLGYKNIKSKKSKNWHFSKGLTHGFAPKMAIFPTFFF